MESEESHVISWSRSRIFKTDGVGVGFFKTDGVGVGFSKLLESGVGTFVAITDSNVY